MKTLFLKKVSVREQDYIIELKFRGVYINFEFGHAQAGDLKGEVALEIEGEKKIKLGDWLSPVNLDYYHIVDQLVNEAANHNIKVDNQLVEKLYQKALSIMKQEKQPNNDGEDTIL